VSEEKSYTGEIMYTKQSERAELRGVGSHRVNREMQLKGVQRERSERDMGEGELEEGSFARNDKYLFVTLVFKRRFLQSCVSLGALMFRGCSRALCIRRNQKILGHKIFFVGQQNFSSFHQVRS
jgi:hypothetical protein